MANEDISFAPNATGADRIDTVSDESLRIWAERLDASPEQIREAVGAVGDRASDVELYLKGSRSTTNDDRVDAAMAGAPNAHADREEQIRKAAYARYEARGNAPGSAEQDWIDAESEHGALEPKRS